ncbi:ABC transporter permease [Alloacidobacterium sp.]|uniref:ABC transporter permease n=1 Tax=Alloacidobacterium sp. TaxID=2951999 RepID=UPI002D617148|nr:ABC transporter permease [Alloacidobacterium sp.]HYK36256.1 ABC transporter permease [Alloacidobacterium sp.]
MESLKSQLKQTMRRLWRAPMFTCIALITLAVGIGANTAVFSVVEGVLLKPLPYPHPNELVGLWHVAPGLNLGDGVNMAPSNYFIYREQNRTFRDIGLYQGDSVSVTGSGEPEQVRALDVTDGLLPVLGISPMLGRVFNHAEATTGGPDSVILTYGYWQTKFGSDRSIIGRTITADGKPRQIIGVMPKNFQFLDWEPVALILPIQFDRNKTMLGQFSYDGIARLKSGETLAAANSDIARMIPTVWNSFPSPPGFSVDLFKKARLGPNVRPLMQDVVGDVGKLLWILMGSIGLVLLIACANVANLLLVRAEGRQQELAIRAALGASRSRIVREFLFESIALGVLGGVLGLALAYGALRLLVAIAPSGLPRVEDIGINLPVLAFAVLASLLASLLSGLIPIMRYSGASMGTGLREGGRSQSQGRERHRTRNTLVVVQVGLAFVLLICSGLMVRTFRALTHVDPGFAQPAQVQTLRLTIPEAVVKDDEKVVRMQQAIMDKIAAIQGVSAVALANSVPMDGGRWMDPVFAQDRNYAEGEMPPLRRFKFVSPGFFHTLGIPLIAGRDYSWAETYQKLPVAIVSENFAREYWGSPQNALGKQIRVSSKDDWRQIVGVVGDIHDDGMNKDAPAIAYWPILVAHFESDMFHVSRTVVFAVRTPRAGSASLMKEVRQAVWSVDSNLPLEDVRALDYYYNKSMARTSFTLVMLAIAGGMALLLGAIGLYGVIAYSVSQRTREIGIRIALGAQRQNITGMFVRQGLILAGVGAACGLVVAIAATRFLSSLLFHVSPVDPVTYISVCLGLAAAAVLASYIPSRRTTAVDPVEALRAE